MYIGLNLYSNIATQGSLSLYPFSLFREHFHLFHTSDPLVYQKQITGIVLGFAVVAFCKTLSDERVLLDFLFKISRLIPRNI
jgi:multisubunit Na+/H+ antiporter MnhC subunit